MPRFCSVACKHLHTNGGGPEVVLARRTQQREPRPSWSLRCRVCGKRLSGSQSKLCSKACRIRVQHEDRKARGAYVLKSGMIECAECGVVFWVDRWATHRKWCSTKCARSLERRSERVRRHHTLDDRVPSRLVFARDNWICWLCQKSTAKKWTRDNPLSPTLDHVVPLAKGGTHTASNLRTAHWVCNTRKGVRVPPGQADLPLEGSVLSLAVLPRAARVCIPSRRREIAPGGVRWLTR